MIVSFIHGPVGCPACETEMTHRY